MSKKRRQNKGLRKLCPCSPKAWPSCLHPYHYNYKPRTGPNAGKPFRLSLDKYAGKHLDSKTLAESVAADVRKKIDDGTYGKKAPQLAGMTIQQLCDRYKEDYVLAERAKTASDFTSQLKTICATPMKTLSGHVIPFGEWQLDDVIFPTLQQFKRVPRLLGTRQTGKNRLFRRLRAMFNWGMDEDRGYVSRTPFKLAKDKRKLLFEKEYARKRRLGTVDCPDEEQKLLAACSPRLRALVECAIETGMRRGEILSLQWQEVRGLIVKEDKRGKFTIEWAARPQIELPAEKTKTKTDRTIPISTRLRALLEMRRFGPDHKPLEPEAFVFGTEIGTKVLGFKRAWNAAVLRSRGIEAAYTKTANLDADSRKAFAAINLHFHDLRREAGSRWLEGGVPLHHIQYWLGHANISMTSTYLGVNSNVSHDSMARFDAQKAALQPIATESRKARPKQTRTTTTGHGKLNKAAVRPSSAVM